MTKKSQIKKTKAKREHIFADSQLTSLAIQWKHLTAAGRHQEAMLLLEEIIKGSTNMFEQLARFENYHYTVDLSLLISAAQQKVLWWLIKWQPRKGRLFSWFSKCAKNAFRSELVRVNQFRKRYVHVAAEDFEKFYGSEDHEVDKHDMASQVKTRLESLVCRWGDSQEIEAIRFLVLCILDEGHKKQAAIRSAAYAYGISFDLSKFFYNWAIVALREAFYESVYIPFTDHELLTAVHSYTFWPEFVDIVGLDKAKECIAKLGGQSLRFPTLQKVAKLRQNYKIFREVQKGDLDPDAMAETGRLFNKSPNTVQRTFDEVSQQIDSHRYGEHSLFDNFND